MALGIDIGIGIEAFGGGAFGTIPSERASKALEGAVCFFFLFSFFFFLLVDDRWIAIGPPTQSYSKGD